MFPLNVVSRRQTVFKAVASPPYLQFHFAWFRWPAVSVASRRVALLLRQRQKEPCAASPRPRHAPPCFSSHGRLTVSRDHKKGEDSAVGPSERDRDHIHATGITIYCRNCPLLLVVDLLLRLIYQLNVFTGMYVWQEKKCTLLSVVSGIC